jgi:FolB domain-containing protein
MSDELNLATNLMTTTQVAGEVFSSQDLCSSPFLIPVAMYFRVGDSVFIRGLSLSAVVGKDVWHRDGKTQPVLIDLEMPTNIEVAAEKDSVSNTIHYGILCKAITKAIKARHFDSLPDLADAISQAAMSEGRGELGLDLTILLPKAHLHAEGVGIRRRQTYESDEGVKVLRSESDILVVKNLRISCIIGVNPHERLEKQMVVFNIRLYSERNPLFGTHVEVFRQIQDVSSGGTSHSTDVSD